MARWRPPVKKSSPYITPEGYKALEDESQQLWQTRKEVTQALAAAAAEGDRSENAEYIYRKKQLRELDRRIRYLQKRMPSLKIVTEIDDDKRVYFGAWITLEDEEENESCYRIVGADEIDPEKNYISIDAPLSRKLLGKQVDDEIEMLTDKVSKQYYILAIKYQ